MRELKSWAKVSPDMKQTCIHRRSLYRKREFGASFRHGKKKLFFNIKKCSSIFKELLDINKNKRILRLYLLKEKDG
jgi:hypothetical protein